MEKIKIVCSNDSRMDKVFLEIFKLLIKKLKEIIQIDESHLLVTSSLVPFSLDLPIYPELDFYISDSDNKKVDNLPLFAYHLNLNDSLTFEIEKEGVYFKEDTKIFVAICGEDKIINKIISVFFSSYYRYKVFGEEDLFSIFEERIKNLELISDEYSKILEIIESLKDENKNFF